MGEKRVNLQYNALGQYTFINRFENLSATNPALRSVYTYDEANRLTELAHRHITSPSSSTLLARYQFSYDALNRITSINSYLDGVSNFTHDLRGQLTNATHASPRPAEQFNYDDNGNRTGGSYATGTNNQTTSDGTYTYTFDSEGNRTRRTKVSDNSYEDYTWDHRNRLNSVTRKSQAGSVLATAAYVYDQFNRLIKRTVDTVGAGSGAAADQFFAGFEGINPTLIFDSADSGDLTNRLLSGDIVDELFADEQITNPTNAGNTLWAASDHLGTIRDLVDFNGTAYTVANHRVYDSFGNLTSETNGSVSSLFGFTGKLFDKEFRLSNHWNRWYDPALGKWISEDPIGFAAGDANLARYVGNRVLDSTDSLGLQEDGSAGLGKVVPQHIVDGAKTNQIELGLTALGAFMQQNPDHFSHFQETYGVDGITDLVTALSWGYQVQFGDNWSAYWGWDIREGSVISIDANTHWLPGQGGHSVAEDNAFLIRALRSGKLKAPKETPDALTVGDFARWSGGDAHSGLRDATHLVQEMIRETSEGIAEKVAETALEAVATKFAVTIIAGIRFAPNSSSPYALFNKTHAGSQPVPKGLGPNGGPLQSHHGLQQEWAANNIPGYRPGLAPTVTLENGKGLPHTVITTLQRQRRDARVAAGLGKWSSSIDDELGFIVSDFRQAGFGDDVVRQVLEQNYRMLDRLGIKYSKPAGF